MKLSLTLSLFLGMATLFQGCGNTDEPQTAAVSTTVKGSATLGTILSNNSTICLDINNNGTCDADEPSASTDAVGQYKIIVDGTVKDGTMIVVEDGVNLLPPPAGEEDQLNLKFYKPYQSNESDQNINVFSTLVANEMQNSPSSTYAEAVETVLNSAFASSTNCSFIDADLVVGDPIGAGGEFLVCMNALQYITYLNDAAQIQASSAPQRAVTAENNATLDGYIDNNAGYFDSLLASINEYTDAFYAWWDSWSLLGDDNAVVEEPPVVDEPVAEEPVVPVTIPVTRGVMDGVWYIIDASGDKTCSYISSNDNISVTEADGKTTDLTLEYLQNGDLASLKLSLGFFSVDTIVITDYKDNNTFTGHYASDNETLQGAAVDTLDNCKSEKLGL